MTENLEELYLKNVFIISPLNFVHNLTYTLPPQFSKHVVPTNTVRELLSFYEFPGDDILIIKYVLYLVRIEELSLWLMIIM